MSDPFKENKIVIQLPVIEIPVNIWSAIISVVACLTAIRIVRIIADMISTLDWMLP